MKRKIVTIAITVAMVVASALSGFTLPSVDVQAAPKKTSGTTDNGKWTYKYYKKTNSVGIRMVYKKVKKDGKTLTIPNTVKIDKKSYKVTRLLEYQFYKGTKQPQKDVEEDLIEDEYFKKVIIPSNVQTIDDDAFTFGERIKEVQFAKNGNLKTIGDGAFSCCGIRHISIPASVTTIKNDAFLDNDITQITFERTSKFTLAKDAFEDNPTGYVYDDYEYEPEDCVVKVANYDIYSWLNNAKTFGEGVIVKSAKTRLYTSDKKYVDINTGYKNVEFDLTKYVTVNKNYDYLGATVEYADSISNTKNFKTRAISVNKKVKSNAYPYMKVKKINSEERVYYIQVPFSKTLEVIGRSNSFNPINSKFTVGMTDTIKFLPYPNSGYLKVGYHIDGYAVDGAGMNEKIFKVNDTAKALTNKKNTLLHASFYYVPNKYEIQYNLHGGEGSIENTQCTYNKEANITSAIPTRTNYKFIGWSKTQNDDYLYQANEIFKNWSSKDGDVVTLYAQWERIKKKIELEISADELSEGDEAEEYMVSYTINGEKVYDRSHTVVGDEPTKITIPDLYVGDVVVVTASGLLTDEDTNSLESQEAVERIVVQ